MKDLDRLWRGADFHQLLYQSIGHAVEVTVEGHMVVDVDGGTRPLAHVETLGRQRRQSWLLESVKQTQTVSPPRASSPIPSGKGPIPAAAARSRYSWTVLSAIPQLRAIERCPNPNFNRNRRTSFTFRMDFLLNGSLISLVTELQCRVIVQRRPALVEIIPLQAERDSGKRQKVFALPPESRSPSQRNAVRNHTGNGVRL
jgi:hypothetical protein